MEDSHSRRASHQFAELFCRVSFDKAIQSYEAIFVCTTVLVKTSSETQHDLYLWLQCYRSLLDW